MRLESSSNMVESFCGRPEAERRGRELAAWLAGLDWRRAKLVVHGEDGHWHSANALDGAALHWRPSEWRRDSRLELIFAREQDAAALVAALDACRLG